MKKRFDWRTELAHKLWQYNNRVDTDLVAAGEYWQHEWEEFIEEVIREEKSPDPKEKTLAEEIEEILKMNNRGISHALWAIAFAINWKVTLIVLPIFAYLYHSKKEGDSTP